MSSAKDLATYIAVTLAQGTVGSNVFHNLMPDSPTNVIVAYEYGGRPSGMAFGDNPSDVSSMVLENPNVQVAVRNANPGTGYDVVYSIYKSLDGLKDVTIGGVFYHWMRALQTPFMLERDVNGRVTYAFNIEIEKRRS